MSMVAIYLLGFTIFYHHLSEEGGMCSFDVKFRSICSILWPLLCIVLIIIAICEAITGREVE